MKASEARIPPDVFSRVARGHERVRIERRGSKPVFLVSEEDVVLLERIKDLYWAREGQRALEEFNKSGRRAIPWKKVKQELGL